MRLLTGRYAGLPVSLAPERYLRWLAGLRNLSPALRREVAVVLGRHSYRHFWERGQGHARH